MTPIRRLLPLTAWTLAIAGFAGAIALGGLWAGRDTYWNSGMPERQVKRMAILVFYDPARVVFGVALLTPSTPTPPKPDIQWHRFFYVHRRASFISEDVVFEIGDSRFIGAPVWAWMTAMLAPAVLLAFTRWRQSQWAAARVQAGACPACGYDLRASPDRCPECGRPVDDVSRDATMMTSQN